MTLLILIYHKVINLKTSKQVWDALKEKYYVTADVQSFEGLQTAIQTRYGDCGGIQDYASKLSEALDKFDTSLAKNKVLPKSTRIQFLLCNLGKVWEAFLILYLNSHFDKQTATYNSIIQVLLQKEIWIKFNTSNTNLVKVKKGK